MKGYRTSFAGMFTGDVAEGLTVRSVEIPLNQRDYAQGRPGGSVSEIRADFLEALLDALLGGQPLSLDFVYGKIEGDVFYPLDGQQRLTTLFLLHWYLASVTSNLDPEAPWTRFSYSTRVSARTFCRRLAANPLPPGQAKANGWIVDQDWYQHLWRHDPTIQSMLVMIDSIEHEVTTRGANHRLEDAWRRLTADSDAAISFYLLPLSEMDSDEELYIKMNSRGKPLTPFESFKARFEQDISHSPRAKEFAHKIDGDWSDLLWPIHGGDFIVDDEFVRYIDFIIEICELREGRLGSGRLGSRAREVFGLENARAHEHLDFLFRAFDVWTDYEQLQRAFDTHFSLVTPSDSSYDSARVPLFGVSSTNLFERCCHEFDSQRSGNRPFSLQQSLYLYAVLLHEIHRSDDFQRRLRTLRNLISASDDEMRRANMPALLADVDAVILRDDLAGVAKLSANQVADEELKGAFLSTHPDLTEAVHRLEDNPLLRGTLSAFELDEATFTSRAGAFEAAFDNPEHWLALTGALLSTGDYQRLRPQSRGWQFGTSSPKNAAVWRYLLTDATRDALDSTRTVLATFLDDLSTSDTTVTSHLAKVMSDWLAQREATETFDWRYYLVKYPAMRGELDERNSGRTGIYYGANSVLGYELCMLRTQQLNGYYRDPFLLQVWLSSEVGDRVEDPWFTGYEWSHRYLRLTRSQVGIRCVPEGFEVTPPENESLTLAFDAVCQGLPNANASESGYTVVVPQEDHDGQAIDVIDRVQLGALLLTQLVDAGL